MLLYSYKLKSLKRRNLKMKAKEIIATIRNLARRDNFYANIYNKLFAVHKVNPKAFALIMEKLEEEKFADATDLVLYFEC